MIFQGLLICVAFLTLFGLVLWPVLFKNSKHWKLIYIGTNITFIVMLIAFGSNVGQNRSRLDARRTQLQDALVLAADALDQGRVVTVPAGEKTEDELAVVSRLIDSLKASTGGAE